MRYYTRQKIAINLSVIASVFAACWLCTAAETENEALNLEKEKVLHSTSLPADGCVVLFTSPVAGDEFISKEWGHVKPISVWKLPILADGAPDWRKGRIIALLPQADTINDPAITICFEDNAATCAYLTAWESGLRLSVQSFSLKEENAGAAPEKTADSRDDELGTLPGTPKTVKTVDGQDRKVFVLPRLPDTVPVKVNGKAVDIVRPIAVVRHSEARVVILVKKRDGKIISVSTDDGGKTWTGKDDDHPAMKAPPSNQSPKPQ